MELTLADKIEKWIVDNANIVIGAFVAILVVCIAYGGYDVYSAKKEERAQEALFEIESGLEKKQQELFEAESKKKLAKDGKKLDTQIAAPVKNPENLQKDLGEPLARLVAFIEQNQGSKASYMAAMTVSDLYLEYKDPAQAAQLLEKVVPHVGKSSLFYGLLNSQLGVAYSNANECAKAVEAYDRILSSDAQKHIHAQMALRKGVCLLTLKEYDKAKSVFRQAKIDHPDTVSGQSAESFERLVNVKKGLMK